MHQSSQLESTFKHLLFSPTLITHSECLKKIIATLKTNKNTNLKQKGEYESIQH